MANKQFINNKNNVVPNDGGSYHSIWVCAVYADRPTSGLSVGDLMVVVNEDAIYVADSTTTWVGGVNLGQIKVPSLYIGDYAGGAYHLVASAASTPQVIAIPNGGGSFVTEDYAQPLDNKTRLGIAVAGGTGVCKIGDLVGAGGAYAAIGLAGDLSLANFNMASSPSDTGLYFNRPSTKQMVFQHNNVSQMTLYAASPMATVPALVGEGADPPASGAMGKVNRTAQAAAVAATKLTDTTAAGYYVVHYTLEDTTGDITAGTIQFQINYTDDIGATTQTGATLALTAVGRDRGSFQVYLASGNITYQTNLVGIIGTSRYALRVRCIHLG